MPHINIYLDIDGVILHKHAASPYADDFLQFIAHHWPESTYWISSYAKMGKQAILDMLTPHLKPRTIRLIEHFKLGYWQDLKTDAIDFKRPFLWFDDTLYPEEAQILKHYHAEQCHRLVHLQTDPYQLLDEYAYLQSIVELY